MKKLIGKIVVASALLFASQAFGQDKNEKAKFVPDASSRPVIVAESNGIKALYQMGTLYGKKAFTIEFQNTNSIMAFTTISWKILVKGEGSSYFGKTRELKLSPGQTISIDRADLSAKPAILIKPETNLDDYKFVMRTHDPAPTE